MAFIQIIEFQTSDIDGFKQLTEEWETASDGQRTATRYNLCQDRDRPGTWMQIVEFPSYEEAMANSESPVTTDFANRLGALCDGSPTFRNLDVADSRTL